MERLKIGLLGAGKISKRHINCIANRNDAEIVAVCDVNEESIEQFKKHSGINGTAIVYFDAQEMYDSGELDAVIICTPHSLHFHQAMRALEAGLHVFLEKPMVTNAKDAKDLAERAATSGKIMTVGYNTSATPVFGYLKEIIDTERFGKLELVNGYLCQNWLAATQGQWRQEPEISGGGQAYDSGAHLMNSLVWSVNSPVDELYAMVDNHGTRVDINSTLTVRFKNGVMASIAIGGNCEHRGSHMVFIFEKGRAEVDGWAGKWMKVYAEGEEIEPSFDQVKQITPTDNFIDSVFERDTVRVTPEHGIILSELMDAIYESAKTKRPVRFSA